MKTHIKLIVAAVTMSLAAALLVGCTSNNRPIAPPPVAPTSVEQPEVSETPTQSATPIDTPSVPDAGVTSDLVGSQTVTTRSGYVIEVSWAIVNWTFSIDTVDAPPGKAILSPNADGQFELTIKNVTPGKNANSDVWYPSADALVSPEAFSFMSPDVSPDGYAVVMWPVGFDADALTVLGPNESVTCVSKPIYQGSYTPQVDEGVADQASALLHNAVYWLYLNGESTTMGQPGIRIPIGWTPKNP